MPKSTTAALPLSSDTATTPVAAIHRPMVTGMFAAPSQARSSTLLTDVAYHWPPRAVVTLRALSASAICLSVVAPVFSASRIMGRTLAANLSASAPTALLRATWSLGFTLQSEKQLRARLKPLIRKTQPYAKKIAHRGIWVEPELLAEIEYRAKSAGGKLRHPFFKGLREDL